MKTFKKVSLTALAIVLSISLTACGSGQPSGNPGTGNPGSNAQSGGKEIELTMVAAFQLEGPSADRIHATNLFVDKFNERAEGKAEIKIVGGPEIVNPFDQLKALQDGQFDMAMTTSTYFNELSNVSFFNYIPYEKQIEVAPDTYELLQKITRESANVIWLQYVLLGSPFYLWTADKPVQTVADAKGLKVRTLPSLAKPLQTHLGLVPTNIGDLDLYNAVQNGVIEGALRDSITVQTLSESDFLKYGTEAPIGYIQGELYISAKTWDSLPEDVRGMMNEVAREAEKESYEWFTQRAEEAKKIMKEQDGVTIVEPDPELKKILSETIPKEITREIVNNSKYKDEIIEKFRLEEYLK